MLKEFDDPWGPARDLCLLCCAQWYATNHCQAKVSKVSSKKTLKTNHLISYLISTSIFPSRVPLHHPNHRRMLLDEFLSHPLYYPVPSPMAGHPLTYKQEIINISYNILFVHLPESLEVVKLLGVYCNSFTMHKYD